MTHYKTGVSPKNNKIGAFVGELYRCHHFTTTDEASDHAIENSKQIFFNNKYPVNLLNQNITEVQNVNFQKSDNLERRQADLDNPDFDNYSFHFHTQARDAQMFLLPITR